MLDHIILTIGSVERSLAFYEAVHRSGQLVAIPPFARVRIKLTLKVVGGVFQAA